MTQPSPESQMNREATLVAQKTARIMRQLLMLARQNQQRRWASQRATDQMTPGHEQTGQDRLAKLAVGWSAANAQRETRPDMAQRWDRVITAHGIDPQELYNTVTQREAFTGEALRQRNAAADATADARELHQDANAHRASAQEAQAQANRQSTPGPDILDTTLGTTAGTIAGASILGDIVEATPTQLDEAVARQTAEFEAATVREGQGAVDPDQLLQAWAKNDLSTALNNHREAGNTTALEAEPPTQSLSLGAAADTGLDR